MKTQVITGLKGGNFRLSNKASGNSRRRLCAFLEWGVGAGFYSLVLAVVIQRSDLSSGGIALDVFADRQEESRPTQKSPG
jgi:hypothetical protein